VDIESPCKTNLYQFRLMRGLGKAGCSTWQLRADYPGVSCSAEIQWERSGVDCRALRSEVLARKTVVRQADLLNWLKPFRSLSIGAADLAISQT
jgi:hypothetical protein